LGQAPSVAAVGELTYLWRRGLIDDQQCGCGTPFSACGFWQAVGKAAFGGWGEVDAAAMLELQRAIDRQRYLPLMIFPRLSRKYASRLSEYRDAMSRVYVAIGAVAGATVVVDSSKHISDAFILRGANSFRFRVAHLVRDSRGVAYSWTKQVAKPETVHEGNAMRRFHPGRMALRWMSYNLLFHLLSATGVPSLRVDYETLVARPQEETERILRFSGLAPVSLDAIEGRSVRLEPTHTVAGNPMRFTVGTLDLRVDDEWREKFPAGQRRWVTILTWPLLRRYGYREDIH
jgi:hypothetical protein